MTIELEVGSLTTENLMLKVGTLVIVTQKMKVKILVNFTIEM